MAISLSIFGIAFVAFCVWLVVRVVNRRERRSRRALAMLIGLTLLYVASFGPACWISSYSTGRAEYLGSQAVSVMYQPILHVAWNGPSIVRKAIVGYARLWSSGRWAVGCTPS